MSEPKYPELYNENANRAYPFEENASRTTAAGVTLPDGAFVDAMIYTDTGTGVPYLSLIDVAARRIEIRDTDTDVLIGFAEFNSSSPDLVIYDSETYMRQVGMLVLADRSWMLEGMQYVFDAGATPFTCACWFRIAMPGVRGFILPDGTLMYGDVIFEGRNGIRTFSYYLGGDNYSGKNVLCIDAIGAVVTITEPASPGLPGSDCVGGGIPITAIRVIVENEAVITASEYEASVIGLAVPGVEASQLCAKPDLPNADGTIPDPDICEPVPAPVPEPEPAPVEIIYDVVIPPSPVGQIVITTPSSPAYSNPVRIVNPVIPPPIPQVGRMPELATDMPAKPPRIVMRYQPDGKLHAMENSF